MRKNILTKIALHLMPLLLSACAASATSTRPSTQTGSYNTNALAGNSKDVMKMLQHNSSKKLVELETATVDNYYDAWYQLALLTKHSNKNVSQFSSDLLAWHEKHPAHPGNDLLPPKERLQQLLNWQPPHHIAVLLPESGSYADSARKIRKGIMNAYYKNIARAGKQNIKFYDTSQQDVTTVYQEALEDGADFIIGPLVKDDVNKISAANVSTPTLALNYADSHLFSSMPAKFYQFGILPEDEARQIAVTARNSGKTNALIIAADTDWGNRMVTAFTSDWSSLGGSVTETWHYTSKTIFSSDIAQLLKVNMTADQQMMRDHNNKADLSKQRRQDFDVVILLTSPQKARVILPLLRYYYAGNIPVFAASSILGDQPDPTRDADFNGVTICHIPALTQSHHQNSALTTNSLYSLGQDAYLISQSLNRVVEMPDLPVYGSTGALTIADKQQIHRRLPCHAIKNGHIQPS